MKLYRLAFLFAKLLLCTLGNDNLFIGLILRLILLHYNRVLTLSKTRSFQAFRYVPFLTVNGEENHLT